MELVNKNDTHRLLISISIPVLNEAANIPILYKRLNALAIKMHDRCNLEFIFSDNHSDDDTWKILMKLASADSRVKAIRFSKNYGFQRSILANYLHARGDAIMQIDADLQDPPEILEEFYDLWKQGYQVIYGIRKKRKEGWLINNFRKLGYFIIDKISEHPIPRDAGDFRLIDRKVVHSLLSIRTANPYIRGMIASLGFNQLGIPYDRDLRAAGKSKFNFFDLIRLGLSAILNHSVVPLRVASFLGLTILGLSLLGAASYLWLYLYHPGLPKGFTSTTILILFGIGLNSFLLGIIGEYILRIYLVLRSDPIAIIEQSLNFSQAELKL